MISKQFSDESHWGLSTAITVHGCNTDYISDRDFIQSFVLDLVDYIDMEAYGETIIERFGEGDLEGYSAMQLIKTSSITMHFSEVDGRAFIDIFSCKGYEPVEAAQFCEDYLSGKSYDMAWMFRD